MFFLDVPFFSLLSTFSGLRVSVAFRRGRFIGYNGEGREEEEDKRKKSMREDDGRMGFK